MKNTKMTKAKTSKSKKSIGVAKDNVDHFPMNRAQRDRMLEQTTKPCPATQHSFYKVDDSYTADDPVRTQCRKCGLVAIVQPIPQATEIDNAGPGNTGNINVAEAKVSVGGVTVEPGDKLEFGILGDQVDVAVEPAKEAVAESEVKNA